MKHCRDLLLLFPCIISHLKMKANLKMLIWSVALSVLCMNSHKAAPLPDAGCCSHSPSLTTDPHSWLATDMELTAVLQWCRWSALILFLYFQNIIGSQPSSVSRHNGIFRT